jgi:phosphatidate cytidylyltransferase
MSRKKSETATRILSALVTLPVYVFLFMTNLFYGFPILIASVVISLACLYEFYQIAKSDVSQGAFIISGLVVGGLVNILMFIHAFGKIYGYDRYISAFDVRILFALLAVFLSVIFIVQLFRRPIKGGIYSMAITVFGVVYIVFSFSHIILLKALVDGSIYILILHLIIMVNDSFAYFGGVSFGKHKTGFAVSPNKSWEGYASGMLAGIIFMLLANHVLNIFFDKYLFSTLEAAVLGAVFSVVGDIGDLIESTVKRDGGIKDSGTIIPGHGGMWDVFDAMIFAMPLFYYYLKIKGV